MQERRLARSASDPRMSLRWRGVWRPSVCSLMLLATGVARSLNGHDSQVCFLPCAESNSDRRKPHFALRKEIDEPSTIQRGLLLRAGPPRRTAAAQEGLLPAADLGLCLCQEISRSCASD